MSAPNPYDSQQYNNDPQAQYAPTSQGYGASAQAQPQQPAQAQAQGYDAYAAQQTPARPAIPSALIGPFTLRESLILLVGLLFLVNSFFPFATLPSFYTSFLPSLTFWTIPGSGFALVLLFVFLPISAAVLILLRRLAPNVNWRVGSLSVDQFASVSAVVTGVAYVAFLLTAIQVVGSISNSLSMMGDFGGSSFSSLTSGSTTVGFSLIFGTVLALGLIFLTTFAKIMPFFSGEFTSRPETIAHPQARPAAAAPRRVQHQATQFAPAAQYPAQQAAQQTTQHQEQYPAQGFAAGTDAGSAAGSAPQSGYAQASYTQPGYVQPESQAQPQTQTHAAFSAQEAQGAQETQVSQPATAQPTAAQPAAEQPAAAQPFWIAVPDARDAFDEATGTPSFRAEPGVWILALEDRGTSLVIRHDDGRVAILHNIDGIHRN